MLNGILVIRKETGYTSNDVVAKLRGICRQRKAGHTGTLDPNAEGVLPVCLGNATKLCDLFTDRDKEYVAELTLGITTDTQDIWGRVLTDSGDKWRGIPVEEIERTVLSFRGRQLQTPPMYSALKVNGKRLYELARAGVEVERKPREIEIEEIELLPSAGCGEEGAHRTVYFSTLPRLRMRVACSKGTYIRTLCQDIGEKLGCGAAMSSLTRTRVGRFRLEDAHTLAEVEQFRDADRLPEILIPVDRCFMEYPAFVVGEEGLRFLKNGNELRENLLRKAGCDPLRERGSAGNPDRWEAVSPVEASGESLCRVYGGDGLFYGIYRQQRGQKTWKPWKMFLPE